MTTYPSAPVDQPTQDTLALMRLDPRHNTDRQIICDVIETVAARGGGDVDPNVLRGELTGLVQPNVIGSTINSLARSGHLVATGWTVTTGSTSGNSGKPCRTYRLVKSLTDSLPTSPSGQGRRRGGDGPRRESAIGSRAGVAGSRVGAPAGLPPRRHSP